MDGGSFSVLLGDIVNAIFGRELKKDYYFAILAETERRKDEGAFEKDRAYFYNYYGDTKDWTNILPPDHESVNIGQASREHRLAFNADQVKAAEEYWGVSHSVMAITSGLLALSRFTGKKHVMINWIFNNRLSPEAAGVVGMLIRNLPAAARMEEFNSIRELLHSVKEQVSGGIAHCDYDFMMDTLQAFKNDCMEVNLEIGINGDELDELPYEKIELRNDYLAAEARMNFELLENEYGDGGFDIDLEWAEGMFDEKKMEAFHELYIKILESLVLRREELL